MYQAITTKFYGPTNNRNMRVRATAQAGSLFHEWDDKLNPDENHLAAARKLAEKQQWFGHWHGGVAKDGTYCFALESRDRRDGFFAGELVPVQLVRK